MEQSPKVDSHKNSPLIFSKGANKEKIVFSRKGARTIKKKKEYWLILCTKVEPWTTQVWTEQVHLYVYF